MCKPGGCAHIRVSKSGGDGVVQARLPPAETLPPFLRHAFLARPGAQYRRILLIDDVMTTGTSARAASRALLEGDNQTL